MPLQWVWVCCMCGFVNAYVYEHVCVHVHVCVYVYVCVCGCAQGPTQADWEVLPSKTQDAPPGMHTTCDAHHLRCTPPGMHHLGRTTSGVRNGENRSPAAFGHMIRPKRKCLPDRGRRFFSGRGLPSVWLAGGYK